MAGFPFTTSHGTPFALVRRWGTAPGSPPSTRTAFITEAVAEKGKIVKLRGYIGDAQFGGWTGSVRGIAPDDVLRQWRAQPQLSTVARCKRNLSKTPAEPRP